MRSFKVSTGAPVQAKSCGLLDRFLRDESGVTALEFGIVSIPFLILVMGMISTGMHFLTLSSLEHGVETAARKIRTGQAQQGGTTVAEFKQDICDAAHSMASCDSKLSVLIQRGANWADITPVPCLDTNGVFVAGTGNDSDTIDTHSGGAGEVVLVTVCYDWEAGNSYMGIVSGLASIFGGPNSSVPDKTVLQAAATFRTEPYQ